MTLTPTKFASSEFHPVNKENDRATSLKAAAESAHPIRLPPTIILYLDLCVRLLF